MHGFAEAARLAAQTCVGHAWNSFWVKMRPSLFSLKRGFLPNKLLDEAQAGR